MTTANVYLTFNGNCEEAFTFYRSVFGGEFSYVGRFHDMPPMEGGPVLSPEEGNRIMHIGLPVSKETRILGCDAVGPEGSAFRMGTNMAISVSTDSKEEADRLFRGLSEGGMVKMPMNETFWGDYFGMLVDPFGIQWMIGASTHAEN